MSGSYFIKESIRASNFDLYGFLREIEEGKVIGKATQ
jgi:hypothetical protein